jgi:predicted  nucleic acid-binding Zn-ribbon protein
LVDVVSAPECQERAAKVQAHNERVSSELARAERGETICLSDLMASQEELITEEIRERQESASAAPGSAPKLVNGCNLEACLRYAQERVSALESERESWQETAQVLDRELTSANERVERWRSHAQDLEREVDARLQELRTLRAELQR